MKQIQVVRTLTATAEARACFASKGKGGGTGVAVTKRNGVEVYRVQFEKGGLAGDTVVLYHYGTPTAEVWLTHPGASILSVYGESKSDADSVNTFLDYHGIATRYTYKPVNGGFQEVN